jgi:TPR repeat protein
MRHAFVILLLLASPAGAAPCLEAECVTRCDTGDGRSCYRLSAYHGGERSRQVLEELACRDGYAPACRSLPGRRFTAAAELATVLCQEGDGDACAGGTCAAGNLAACLAASPSAWQPPAVLDGPTLKGNAALCQAGLLDRCMTAGFHLEHGVGVPADKVLAAALYTSACLHGVIDGCVQAGRLSSVPVALWLLRRSCPESGGPGCVPLASLDPGTAKRGLWATCDEDPFACFTLGTLLERDERRAPSEPASTYAKGCNGGCSRSCRRLGELFRDGKLILRDEERAAAFFYRACALGDTKSCARSIPRP